MESDEAFARRLQAQEMGIRLNPPDAQTPLMQQDRAGTEENNPTVLNARLNEIAGARASVYAICVVNIPQIIAAFVILAVSWEDQDPCGLIDAERWKWWVLISAVRMLIFTGCVMLLYFGREWLTSRSEWTRRLTSLRNMSDAAGLVWFVIGNMWFFSRGSGCSDASKSAVYILGAIMIAVNYLQICLPCIIALLLIPVFCCCMPCLIRAMARIQDPRATKGATESAIELLPLVTIQSDTEGVEGSCPICLNDMIVGEDVRILSCKHVFHKQCLDEWLRVNASCPTCRTSIFVTNNGRVDVNTNERSSEGGSTDANNFRDIEMQNNSSASIH